MNNEAFLDAWIDDIRAVTGRLFGATTYSRLLGDLATSVGVTRRPSTTTIHRAVARAQSLARYEGQASDPGSAVDPRAMRRALEPVMREAMQQIAAVARPPTNITGPAEAQAHDASATSVRLQMAEAELTDALARLSRSENENAALRREAAVANARAEVAEAQIPHLLERILGAIDDSAGALADVSRKLSATESFLKLRNDAVRTQMSAEADALKSRVKYLQERIDQLLLDNDQYRRALANRNTGS
ncbi:hypothetical protein [Pararobbsia alpina]|uniref:hypothetical protein n=1 Tax=Pararobbsia alpina TaxID=621374 RepID=UPI0039A6CBD2